ncbi:MAG: Hsp20/alpha crystallin family protein [Rubrivivax sp.]|nr:Hsp20/alpha crystallin family protein [Rubrivivax sp.]
MNTLNTARDIARESARDTAPAPREERPALLPPVDVIEDSGGITLYADLPGVAKEQLHLRVDGEQLAIEAEMTLPASAELTPLHTEVARSAYRRTFTLSKELDAAQVSAELSQGVLRVRIPKAAHAQPRRVDVRVA